MALHRSLFKEFDTDSNGSISFSELQAALAALGMNVSEPVAKYLFEQLDRDSSGQIELNEFEHFIFVFQNADFSSPASVIFYAADYSHDEEIGTSELQRALLKLNVRRSKEECRKLSARVTGKAGRRLGYEEFLEVLQILRDEGEVLQSDVSGVFGDGDGIGNMGGAGGQSGWQSGAGGAQAAGSGPTPGPEPGIGPDFGPDFGPNFDLDLALGAGPGNRDAGARNQAEDITDPLEFLNYLRDI